MNSHLATSHETGEIEGWLKKKSPKAQGSKVVDLWQRRYFVLGGGELRYFKSEKAASLSNAESLKAIRLDQVLGAAPNPKHLDMFLIDLGQERKVKLQAANERERDAWVAAIEAAKLRAWAAAEQASGDGSSACDHGSMESATSSQAVHAPHRLRDQDAPATPAHPHTTGSEATQQRPTLTISHEDLKVVRHHPGSKLGCCAIC